MESWTQMVFQFEITVIYQIMFDKISSKFETWRTQVREILQFSFGCFSIVQSEVIACFEVDSYCWIREMLQVDRQNFLEERDEMNEIFIALDELLVVWILVNCGFCSCSSLLTTSLRVSLHMCQLWSNSYLWNIVVVEFVVTQSNVHVQCQEISE